MLSLRHSHNISVSDRDCGERCCICLFMSQRNVNGAGVTDLCVCVCVCVCKVPKTLIAVLEDFDTAKT